MAFVSAIPLGRVGGRGHRPYGGYPLPAAPGQWRSVPTTTTTTPTAPSPGGPTPFTTTSPRCGALEESKKRNKYNIPDLNDQYRAEVAAVERKYGGRPPSSSASAAGGAAGATRRSSTGSVLYQPGGVRVGAASASAADAAADAAVDRAAALEPYRRVQRALVGDTLTLGALAVAAAWAGLPATDARSVAVGVAASLVYVYLLGRGVDRLADGALASGGAAGAADGLAPARIGIAGLVLVGAARSGGAVHVLPALAGFFVYKVAALMPLVTGAAYED